MNKLTDEQLKELRELYRGECKWAADPEHVRSLLQEVEQLRLHQEVNQSWSLHMIESQILMGEEIERLKGQLQDALEAMDEASDRVYTFQYAYDILQQAIQRIQEEGKQTNE